MKFILFTLCALVALQHCHGAPFPDPEADPDFLGIGGWFEKAGKDTGNWFKKAGEDTKTWVNGAARDTKNWVNGAAKDTKDWVNGAAKDTKDWVNGAAKDTEKWVNGAAKDTKDWVNGAARDTEKWVKGAARDTEQWFKDAAGSVTDFFNKAGKEITKAFNEVKKGWNDFERDANKFFKKAGEEIKKQIADIKKRIEETGDSIVKVIFQKIYEALQDVRRKLDDYSKTADQKFEKAMVEVKTKLFSSTSQVKNFMNRMRGLISRKQNKVKGMEILEKYLKESTSKIESCSDAAIEPIRDLYEATKQFINKSIDKLEEFLKDVEGCLDKGISSETAKCGKNLGKIAKTALKELGGELINMKATLISSAISEAGNMVCVARTRIEVEINKKQVESVIMKLK